MMDPSLLHARVGHPPSREHLGPVDPSAVLVQPNEGAYLPPEAADELASVGVALRDGQRSLSPAGLVSAADGRLSDLDGQIGELMVGLHDRAHTVDTANTQIQGLQALRGALVNDGATQPGDTRGGDLQLTWQGKTVTIDGLLEGLGLSDAMARTDDGGVRLGAVDALIEQEKTEVSRANSANELQMIRLQSLMSQRTPVIELITRMLRAVNDSREAVVRNLGA